MLTSGTTGTAKYIHESASGASAKALTSHLRTASIIAIAPVVLKGALLPLSNAPTFGTTEGGIPFGAASGLTLAAASENIRKRVAYPMDVMNIQHQESMDYVMMRFALMQDVRAIVTNNAGRAEQLFDVARKKADQLIQDIEAGTIRGAIELEPEMRARLEGQLTADPARAADLRCLLQSQPFIPRYYWPNLAIFSCWLGGSVGRFVRCVQDMVPDGCRFVDCGYGASEGKFNIPLVAGSSAGATALHAAFYEFQPLDGGEPLLLHQLQDKTAYNLIVTTYSGLYRYNMHDVVYVDGFTGNTPNIRFERKSGDVYNIAGEKLAASVIVRVVERLPESLREGIRYYAVVPEDDAARYCFYIEPAPGASLNMAMLSELLDDGLVQESIAYRIYYDQGLIKPCRVVLMRSGWQEHVYASRRKPGQTTAQVKLPVLMLEPPESDFVLK